MPSIPASQCRFFIAKTLLAAWFALCLLCSNLAAQTETKIAGTITDRITGGPVPGAVVAIAGVGRSAVADNSGRFYFNDLPAGDYRLIASRIGYENSSAVNVRVESFAPSNAAIQMTPSPVETAGQVVTSERASPFVIRNTGNVTTIEMEPGDLRSLADLASQTPELELVDSGARQVIRIRGAQANGTVVMLDGHPLNSTYNSEADISTVPLGSVKTVEITRGADYKSDGLSGSVNFITSIEKGNGISSSAQRGSYGYESYGAQFGHLGSGKFKAAFDSKDSFTRGNFKFVNLRDSTETRANNFSHDLNLFGQLGWSGLADITLKGRYFSRHSGVPGPIFQYTPDARANSSERELYLSAQKQIAHGVGLDLTAGATSREANYDSPQTPTNIIHYSTRFIENARDIKLQAARKGKIDIDTYLSLRYESLDGKDLVRPAQSFGQHSRTVNTAALGLTFHLPEFAYTRENIITLGLKKHGGQNGDFWAPSGSLRMNFDLPSSPGFDISYFRSRRLPDLTDLYWKEDVFATPNPGLAPEKSHGFDIGIDTRIQSHGQYKLRVSRYETNYDDIIIWRKWAGDKFKPVNLSSAFIGGWEISFNAAPLNGPLTIFYNASLISPLNKESEPTHHDKYLTFRPIGLQNVGIEFDWHNLNLKLTARHLGRRYVTEENTKSLPPVDLADISTAYKIKFNTINIVTSFSILNIADVHYEILDRQPEHPREYRLGIEISKLGDII